MAIFTVHEPPPRGNEAVSAPERFVFVRDGFYFWAFLLAPVWMLLRRLWVALILYLLVLGALEAGLWFAGAPPIVWAVSNVLLAVLVGLEAGSLRRWTLARRHWKMLGVAVGDDLETAERRFFDSWTGGSGQPTGLPPPTGAYYGGAEPQGSVFGLFPEPGVQR